MNIFKGTPGSEKAIGTATPAQLGYDHESYDQKDIHVPADIVVYYDETGEYESHDLCRFDSFGNNTAAGYLDGVKTDSSHLEWIASDVLNIM